MRTTTWLSMFTLALMPPVWSRPPVAGYAFQEKDTIRRTLRFEPGATRALEVRNINGSIRLVGIDGDTIDLVANRIINADSQNDLSEARRAVRLETTATVNGINVCADVAAGCRCDERMHHERQRWSMAAYRVDAELELRVPRDAALRLCTVNGGDVTVDRTSGGFDVSHVNGDIKMSDLHGSGRAATVNGAVIVSFVEMSESASSFKTVNGDVAVSLPPDVSLDLRLKTTNGGLLTDFDATFLAAQAVTPERRGAAFVYRRHRETKVRVGRGGPEISLETVNGDVRVLRR